VLNYYQDTGPVHTRFERETATGFDPEIPDRFRSENRSAIFPERFLIAIIIAVRIFQSVSGMAVTLPIIP
jgi:hypothetical protein